MQPPNNKAQSVLKGHICQSMPHAAGRTPFANWLQGEGTHPSCLSEKSHQSLRSWLWKESPGSKMASMEPAEATAVSGFPGTMAAKCTSLVVPGGSAWPGRLKRGRTMITASPECLKPLEPKTKQWYSVVLAMAGITRRDQAQGCN